jgi:hypothetical protein
MTNCELTKRIELLQTIKKLRFFRQNFTDKLTTNLNDDIEAGFSLSGNSFAATVFENLETEIYEKMVSEERRLMNELNNLNK